MVRVVLPRVSLLTQPVLSLHWTISYTTNYIPLAEFFEMGDLYILCTKPPACVLFQRDSSAHTKFEDLDAKIIPVFPLERSITVKGYSVRRR